MQTLVFNTTTKTAKLYGGKAEDSEILYTFGDVPTVNRGWILPSNANRWNFSRRKKSSSCSFPNSKHKHVN